MHEKPLLPPEVAWQRRALLAVLTLGTTAAACLQMHALLSVNAFTPAEATLLFLFACCFGWVALHFFSALAGAWVLWRNARTPGLLWPSGEERLTQKVAVLLPVHNEEPASVFAHLQAIYESVAATGQLHAFDFFVLSDTRQPDIWVAEERAWAELCRRVGGEGRVFYRRRRHNTAKKAGNVADFCQRWGRHYECMVVLDADSLMEGRTLVSMARLMEANPMVGILQVPPANVGRSTPFARLQQFAGRLYGPLFSAGLSWWQLGESNYWGHNAILRTQAFIAHCGLPELPGRPPFGGHILSHDFVEAALMRRGGWQVWLVPELGGSFEQPPPTLLEYAGRDRRWCQGNLQHLALLFAGGLHPLSRLHLLCGALSYLASPAWLLLLVAGVGAAWADARQVPDYFPAGAFTLFPRWPVFDALAALRLLAISFGMLNVPKALAVALALVREPEGFGGRTRLVASFVLESALSVLLAPVMMLFQTQAVLSALLGVKVRWDAQARGDRAVPFGLALRRHVPHLVVGGALGVGAWGASPLLLAWMSPVVAGLLLSAPLTVLTSHPGLGLWLRRKGLLLTPEEVAPPRLLERARFLEAEAEAERPEALTLLREDAAVRALHLALLEAEGGSTAPSTEARAVGVKLARQGVEALKDAERLTLLADATVLGEVCAGQLATSA